MDLFLPFIDTLQDTGEGVRAARNSQARERQRRNASVSRGSEELLFERIGIPDYRRVEFAHQDVERLKQVIACRISNS